MGEVINFSKHLSSGSFIVKFKSHAAFIMTRHVNGYPTIGIFKKISTLKIPNMKPIFGIQEIFRFILKSILIGYN